MRKERNASGNDFKMCHVLAGFYGITAKIKL